MFISLNLIVVHCGKCTINNQLPVYPLFPSSGCYIMWCFISSKKLEYTKKTPLHECILHLFHLLFLPLGFWRRFPYLGTVQSSQNKVQLSSEAKNIHSYLLQHPYSHQHCSVWISNSSTDLPVKGHCTGQMQDAWPRITSSVGHFTVVAKLSQVCITA